MSGKNRENVKEEKEIDGPAGKFLIALYRSQNDSLRKPWVFSVRDPESHLEQGFARSRRKAERMIRRNVARREAMLLRKNHARIARAAAIEQLEDAGLSETEINRFSRGAEIECSPLRPGEIIASYLSRGFHGDEWYAVLFLDGKERLKEHGRSRREAERKVRKRLQDVYRQEALRALGPEHAPD